MLLQSQLKVLRFEGLKEWIMEGKEVGKGKRRVLFWVGLTGILGLFGGPLRLAPALQFSKELNVLHIVTVLQFKQFC